MRVQQLFDLGLQFGVARADSTGVLLLLSLWKVDQVFEDRVYALLVDGWTEVGLQLRTEFVRLLQMTMQPDLREGPIALDGRGCDV